MPARPCACVASLLNCSRTDHGSTPPRISASGLSCSPSRTPRPLLAGGDCPEEPVFQNYTGAGTTACACFVSGEEAGSVFDVPADHYPIEILRIGVGWGSQFGGAPQSLEQSIHVYPAGLPNPGAPIFTLDGPALNDGFINEFDIEPLPGEVIVNGGPFTVTLEFLNDNVGDPFAPTTVHDGNGCQAGKNVIKAIPGGWSDVCSLGLSGDWLFHIVYRRTDCDANGTYCVLSPNSETAGATMGFIGSTSIAANDLTIFAQDVPVNKPGIFFYGPSQIAVPFGDGTRCVGGMTTRVQPPVFSDIFGNTPRVVDYNSPPFDSGSGMIASGNTWNFQLWFRDPMGPGGNGLQPVERALADVRAVAGHAGSWCG